ncbi:hypothetical protein Gotur_026686 [Gossypium turneri]
MRGMYHHFGGRAVTTGVVGGWVCTCRIRSMRHILGAGG